MLDLLGAGCKEISKKERKNCLFLLRHILVNFKYGKKSYNMLGSTNLQQLILYDYMFICSVFL